VERVLWAIAGVLGAGLAALLAVEVIHRAARRLGRRSALVGELAAKAHRPFQVFLTLFGMQLAIRTFVRSFPARDEVLHGVVLALIAAAAWLLGALLLVFEDVALSRYRTDVRDNLRQRRLHTQVVMLRRVTVAVVVLLAVGVALMTFPAVRTVGASLLASAGVIGVIAGLAAQSMLSNVFAGLQLTFSDAIRLDDVVVVEGEWGKIEEITLSHVVVRIWDDRRLIMPTSYFTTTPFEHWTRTSAELLGTVELDVDWALPVPAMRDELTSLLAGTELWDGRVGVLQVTDAVGGQVRVRALVSAAYAPTLWDLRCLVREHLVAWVRDRRPVGLPRLRAEIAEPRPVRRTRSTTDARDGRSGDGRSGDGRSGDGRSGDGRSGDARVFSGTEEKSARGTAFGGPEERDRDGAAGSRTR
jgi:small-conductance mechanosensitive channel